MTYRKGSAKHRKITGQINAKAKNKQPQKTVVVEGIQGKLRAVKEGENVQAFVLYKETGEIAPFRGCSLTGTPRVSKDEENKQRGISVSAWSLH